MSSKSLISASMTWALVSFPLRIELKSPIMSCEFLDNRFQVFNCRPQLLPVLNCMKSICSSKTNKIVSAMILNRAFKWANIQDTNLNHPSIPELPDSTCHWHRNLKATSILALPSWLFLFVESLYVPLQQVSNDINMLFFFITLGNSLCLCNLLNPLTYYFYQRCVT